MNVVHEEGRTRVEFDGLGEIAPYSETITQSLGLFAGWGLKRRIAGAVLAGQSEEPFVLETSTRKAQRMGSVAFVLARTATCSGERINQLVDFSRALRVEPPEHDIGQSLIL